MFEDIPVNITCVVKKTNAVDHVRWIIGHLDITRNATQNEYENERGDYFVRSILLFHPKMHFDGMLLTCNGGKDQRPVDPLLLKISRTYTYIEVFLQLTLYAEVGVCEITLISYYPVDGQIFAYLLSQKIETFFYHFELDKNVSPNVKVTNTSKAIYFVPLLLVSHSASVLSHLLNYTLERFSTAPLLPVQ